MRKFLSVLIIVIITGSTAMAQKLGTVTGKVADENGKPLQNATVTLLKARDSSLAKTAISASNGEFDMSGIRSGKYFLATTSVGYGKNSTASFDLTEGENQKAPAIVMAAKSGALAEVAVVGKKPMIEVRADKTIFNVENSINATGSNAFELLQKSPGVVTDRDDNISLKGKSGVRIYIDGKPSQMSNKDVAEYLKSMNSADIELIEMISNPSAKYDASGNAGIINIRLKKNKKYGANGSVAVGLTVGETPKENSSLSLNYRNKVVNLFSNYSNFFGKRESIFNLYRRQADSIYDQETVMINDGKTNNFKLGADFFMSKTSTIGFMVNGSLNNSSFFSNGSTVISPMGQTVPTKILYASNDNPATRNNMNYNINYRFLDTAGNELNLDFDYGTFRGRGISTQPNEYRTPFTNEFINGNLSTANSPGNIDILSFKADYEQSFMKGKLGFGGKYSKVETINSFSVMDRVNNIDTFNLQRSNDFDYTENVNALYVNYNRPLGKKWAMQAGVRMENTVSEGILTSATKQADANVKRSYTDFFPSGALTYNYSDKHSFNLTYSRRIDRPSYQDLNPFENKIDELTYQKGNAFLRPQYTNSVEFTHTFLSRFNTTLGYSHVKDYEAQILDTANENRTFITQKNLASQDIYSASLSAPVTIKKWWNLFASLNGYHSKYKADFGAGKILNVNVTAYSIFGQNTFSLKDGLSFELSGWYNSPNIWGGTFRNKAMGGMDIGMQKTLFQGKGNVKFSYTDFLKTMKWRGISDFGGTYADASGSWESQTFRVNLTYRFGNNQVKAARQRKTGTEEENKRLNGSGGLGGG